MTRRRCRPTAMLGAMARHEVLVFRHWRSGTRHHSERSTASTLYGIIVSAAVLAASHADTATALAVGVLVTLLIYWSAERYSRLLAQRIHAGHRPAWGQVRAQLTSDWEFVTASFLPLGTLVILRVLGVDLFWSTLGALICSTLLLCAAGWHAGASGELTTWERVGSAAVTGAFGIGLITLKALLH